MVGAGTIVSGGHVRNSVISGGVRIDAGAYVEGSVIMPGVQIGAGAVVRNAVLDKNITVAEGAQLGVDLDYDRGIVMIGKGLSVPPL